MSERLVDEERADEAPQELVLRAWASRKMRSRNAALRAEAGRLREALDKLRHSAQESLSNPHSTKAVWADYIFEVADKALSSTPLSAAALERWKAMERVVEAARNLYENLPGLGTPNGAAALGDALAALDRTE